MNWYKISQLNNETPEENIENVNENSFFDSDFQSWFQGSKVVDAQGNPLKVYHGTNAVFDKFDLDCSAQGLIWFSSDKNRILDGVSGACGTNFIKEVYLSIKNPAGWDEYDKLGIWELKREGYDGIFLDDNFVVFEPSQIRIV